VLVEEEEARARVAVVEADAAGGGVLGAELHHPQHRAAARHLLVDDEAARHADRGRAELLDHVGVVELPDERLGVGDGRQVREPKRADDAVAVEDRVGDARLVEGVDQAPARAGGGRVQQAELLDVDAVPVLGQPLELGGRLDAPDL